VFREFGKLNETIVADWCQALYTVGAHYPGKHPGPSASMMRSIWTGVVMPFSTPALT
jgi:hypothetical protein